MSFPFKQEPENGLIIISIEIDSKFELKMVLDTGATNTTIDSNALYLPGYDLKNSIGVVQIETANGIIEMKIFKFFTCTLLNKMFNLFKLWLCFKHTVAYKQFD